MRRVFLWAARNAWLKDHLPRLPFMRRAVGRFMPGDTIEDALAAALPLQAAGVASMYTRLGENLEHVEEAEAIAAHYLDVIDKIVAAGINGEISVKPTQLGMDLDAEDLLRSSRADRREGSSRRLVPLDRHGVERLRRGDHRPVRTAPRRPAADRDLPPGLSQAGPPATSSGCGRSIRRSASSRAPTTSRHRSPTAQVEHRRQLRRPGGRGFCSAAAVVRSGWASARTTSRSSSRSPTSLGRRASARTASRSRCCTASGPTEQFRLAKAGYRVAVAHRLRRALVSVVHAPR